MTDEFSNINHVLATLKSQYIMHKEKFEKWKKDNEEQRGSETYNKYIEDFKDWEAGVQERQRQLIMKRNNICGLIDVDQILDVLLAGISFEDFMVAIATMTSKEKTFFPSLLSAFRNINNSRDIRPCTYQNFPTTASYPSSIPHPYSTHQYGPSATQTAVPSYQAYPLTQSDVVVSNVVKRPFERATVLPAPHDKWKIEGPPRKNFRAPSPVKDYRNPSTLPFRDFSQT